MKGMTMPKVAQAPAPDPSPEELMATIHELLNQEEHAATRGDLRSRKAFANQAVEVVARLHVLVAKRALDAHQASYDLAVARARSAAGMKFTGARLH